ncbi:MAG: hypothetical protein VX966_01955 [Chloroflexota bacterium]|nr:hypothetical protein [Chloroflexota bacterium]
MIKDKFKRPEEMRVRQKTVCSALKICRNLVGAKTLVETGTYQGHTVEALIREFEKIMSVDLSQECLDVAQVRIDRQKRFKRIRGKGPAEVSLVCGNSLEVLPSFLDSIEGSAVFWLDAHYSGGNTKRLDSQDCIVLEELLLILDHDSSGTKEDSRTLVHAIVIDDARCMGKGDYPTIAEVVEVVRNRKDNVRIKIEDDMIKILPVSANDVDSIS